MANRYESWSQWLYDQVVNIHHYATHEEFMEYFEQMRVNASLISQSDQELTQYLAEVWTWMNFWNRRNSGGFPGRDPRETRRQTVPETVRRCEEPEASRCNLGENRPWPPTREQASGSNTSRTKPNQMPDFRSGHSTLNKVSTKDKSAQSQRRLTNSRTARGDVLSEFPKRQGGNPIIKKSQPRFPLFPDARYPSPDHQRGEPGYLDFGERPAGYRRPNRQTIAGQGIYRDSDSRDPVGPSGEGESGCVDIGDGSSSDGDGGDGDAFTEPVEMDEDPDEHIQ